jgi:protein involved in polysaccharide export with SLBB domain
MMDWLRKTGCWITVMGLLGVGLMAGGCRSSEAVYSDVPVAAYTGRIDSAADTLVLHVGDLVTIHLPDAAQPFEDRVKEDGTITLPLIGSIVVVGKTARELGKQLREKYARLGIVIPAPREDFVYYVAGEVKSPGLQEYIGETTVTKAIQAAGDFTEFANKKKVKLIHPDGRYEVITDLLKAINPPHDPAVHPGDRIEVPRKWRFGF